MRTDSEILSQIEKVREFDFFGTQVGDLICRLPFEVAKQFLVDDAKAEDWKVLPRDRESLIAEMLDYMDFAWGKANGERGLSAARSLAHYAAWVWLAGDDLGNLLEYEYYGKPNLIKICEHYGFDHTQWDDGVRKN